MGGAAEGGGAQSNPGGVSPAHQKSLEKTRLLALQLPGRSGGSGLWYGQQRPPPPSRPSAHQPASCFLPLLELLSQPGEDPKTHGHLFPDSELHSTRAVVLAVVLALLLAALVLVVIKICRQSRELSLSTVWSTMDDKELLMRSGYTL
uniref:Uncharacterized protein n=1 Tax=Sphaerodactylus townsendi TaxID=933632 RepID=A0ACB8FFF0_9SAUR